MANNQTKFDNTQKQRLLLGPKLRLALQISLPSKQDRVISNLGYSSDRRECDPLSKISKTHENEEEIFPEADR